MIGRWLSLLVMLMAFVISGCEEPEETAETTAIAYFHALYVTADLDEARRLAGPKLRELMDHYGNVASIRRHVIAFYVEQPEITVTQTTEDFLRKVTTEAIVQVHFRGTVDNAVVEKDREVVVKKTGQHWRVMEILPDRFQAGG